MCWKTFQYLTNICICFLFMCSVFLWVCKNKVYVCSWYVPQGFEHENVRWKSADQFQTFFYFEPQKILHQPSCISLFQHPVSTSWPNTCYISIQSPQSVNPPSHHQHPPHHHCRHHHQNLNPHHHHHQCRHHGDMTQCIVVAVNCDREQIKRRRWEWHKQKILKLEF